MSYVSFLYILLAGTSAEGQQLEAGCLFYFEKDLMSQKLPPMGRFLKKSLTTHSSVAVHISQYHYTPLLVGIALDKSLTNRSPLRNF